PAGQAFDGVERRDAGDRGGSGDLRGPGRRKPAHLRAGPGAADGATLLPVLTARRPAAERSPWGGRAARPLGGSRSEPAARSPAAQSQSRSAVKDRKSGV